MLQGLIKPHECAAFGTECTPRTPLGATMVSSEGACAAYYLYRRLGGPTAATRRRRAGWLTAPVSTADARRLAPGRCPALDFEAGPARCRCGTHRAIVMGHGGGGALSAELVDHLFVPAFSPDPAAPTVLRALGDSAVVELGGARLAFSTDSYVVRPMFFPGGSIGDLAVNGTVNDLAMSGAQAAYLSCGFILEEGTDLEWSAGSPQAIGAAARGGRRHGGHRRHQGRGRRARRRRVRQHGRDRPGPDRRGHPPRPGPAR